MSPSTFLLFTLLALLATITATASDSDSDSDSHHHHHHRQKKDLTPEQEKALWTRILEYPERERKRKDHDSIRILNFMESWSQDPVKLHIGRHEHGYMEKCHNLVRAHSTIACGGAECPDIHELYEAVCSDFFFASKAVIIKACCPRINMEENQIVE